MKKLSLYIMLFILAITANTYAFSERRQQWWELQLDTLEKEYETYKNSPNVIIKNTIRNEIETAQNVIKTFNTNFAASDDTNTGRTEYSDEEIIQKTTDYFEAAFNVKYLNNILQYSNFNELNDSAKLFIHSYTSAYLGRNFPNVDDNFTASFISEREQNFYRKYITLESILQSSISGYRTESAAAKSVMTKAALTETQKRDNFLYDYEIKAIINKVITDYFSENGFSENLNSNPQIFNETWVVSNLKMYYDSAIKQYKLVSALLEYAPGDKNITKLDFYNKRPELLEKTAFKFFRLNLLNKEQYFFTDDGEYHPADPELAQIYDNIDKQKNGFAAQINGFENDKSFNEIEKFFNESIALGFKDSSLFFNARDSKIKKSMNNMDKNQSVDVSNHKPDESDGLSFDDFLKTNHEIYYNTRNVYKNKLNSAKKYAKASILYLQWLSETKKLPAESIEKTFHYRITKNREYADFIFLLDSSFDKLADLEDRNISAEIYAGAKPLAELINTLNQSLSIELRERAHLVPGKITEFNAIREKEISKNNFHVSDRKNSRKIYYAVQADYILKKKKRDDEVKKKLAQYEITVLADRIKSNMDSYDRLDYSEKIFDKYSQQYAELEDKCRNGIYPPELDSVLKTGSVFTLLENYSGQRLQNETEAKVYLKQAIQKNTVQIRSLLQYYKSQQIELISPPSLSELYDKLQKMNTVTQVKVASWNMNESNYAEVDKKAVLSIRRMYMKVASNNENGSKTEKSKASPDKKYSFGEYGMSLTIPFGWENVQISEKQEKSGMIACFKNMSDSSEFRISSLEKNTSTQEKTDEWINSCGFSISQIGWKQVGKDSIYWNISNDGKDNVIKACSFELEGKILLIYGKSTKKMFPFFSRRFDNVINSVILSR